MKLSAKKFLPVALVIVLALVLIASSGGVALAQSTPTSTTVTASNSQTTPGNPFSCGISTLDTCIPYLIFEISSPIFDLLISIASWIIIVGLQLCLNVSNSPAIQTGFGVCLAIANLAFILMIIVIAIATILQSDSYGYKKALPRLIAMAILVNFGLVITAPIISFSNSMTNYFMTSINGGTTGATGFANQLMQATSPATVNQAPTTNCPQANLANSQAPGVLSQATLQAMCAQSNGSTAAGTPTAGASFTQSMLALFFGMIFKFIVVIAFLSIGVLLFVRYLWLGVLLILLPFAWIAWVFPKFSGEFGKWWSNFIKWSFFPPAAMFFIWLAMLINQKGYLAQVGNTGAQGVTTNTPATAIAIMIGNSVSLNQFMNNIIVLGIMIGGLIAASSMTGKAGNFVVGQAKAVSNKVTGAITKPVTGAAKGIGGYAGKQTKKVSRWAFRKVGGDTATDNLRRGNIGALKYVPGARRVASITGRGLGNITDNRAMVAEATKKVPDKKEDWIKDMEGSMRDELRMAYFTKHPEWVKPGLTVDGDEVSDYLKKNKGTFHSYGQDGEGSTEEKTRDKSGLTFSEGSKEMEELEAKNATLDAKRTPSPDDIKARAGLSDDDMAFYERMKVKEQNPEDMFTTAEETRYGDIKRREEKAKVALGLSEEEQKQYEENQQKIDKFTGKIKKLAGSDPELVGGVFMNDDKARRDLEREGKKIPVTLEKESIDRVRRTILSTFAEAFSPQNARGLIDAVAKNNNLEYFESAVNDVKKNNPPKFEEIKVSLKENKDLKRWMQNNSGKALFGNLRELFELPKIVKRRNGRVVDESEGEEEEETRTT
jgi:hypothetical protein